MEKYQIWFNVCGKSYEENITDATELKARLKEFLIKQNEENNADYDAQVYSLQTHEGVYCGWVNITESQFICELVSEIMDEVENGI